MFDRVQRSINEASEPQRDILHNHSLCCSLHKRCLRVLHAMGSLQPPKGPRKRSSTTELGREYHKRTEAAVDQDSSGEDISELFSQMKLKWKMERKSKEKEREHRNILKEGRRRRRVHCCSCIGETGLDGDQCKVCGHQRCPICLL